MKKIHLLSAIAIVVTFATIFTLQSCTKLASLLHKDLTMQTGSVNVVIPPTLVTSTSSFGTASNSYNVDSFIKANTGNALGISNITSVKIVSCTITLLNPNTTNNFANFQSCTSSFYSNTDATPYTLSIPNNPDTYATTLSLPVDTTQELKSYLNGTNFTYSLGGQLRRATTDSMQCTVQFAFKMNVQG